MRDDQRQIDRLLADNEYLRSQQDGYEVVLQGMSSEICSLKKQLSAVSGVFKSAEDMNVQTIRKLTAANKVLVRKLALLEDELNAQRDVPDIRPDWQKEQHEDAAKEDSSCRICSQQCPEMKALLDQIDGVRSQCEKSATGPSLVEAGLLNEVRRIQMRCDNVLGFKSLVKGELATGLYT